MRQLFVVPICWCVALAVQAEEITIAVASNFTAVMAEIVTGFEQKSEHRVQVASGSSGRLYAQIVNGAPFQLFFSADQAKPLALVDAGQAIIDSQFTYAIGRLALWSSQADLANSHREALQQGQFNKLALANPRLAPYGIAAVEVLESLDLAGVTQSKWVQGENIAQAFQFVATGNADLGFVALAQLKQNGADSSEGYWLVPENLHTPIRQDAVLLNAGNSSIAAVEFMRFMHSEHAGIIIKAYGYQTASN